MTASEIYQNSLNALRKQVMDTLTSKVSDLGTKRISITGEVVFQYFSEQYKELVDTVNVYTGDVKLKTNNHIRLVKLKELSIQDLINIIGCIERKEYVL